MLNGANQFVYASDYPHWDFDLPSRIYDLPFLSESDKRQILGGNALRLFGLDPASIVSPSPVAGPAGGNA